MGGQRVEHFPDADIAGRRRVPARSVHVASLEPNNTSLGGMEVRNMYELPRGPQGILIIVAIVLYIALAIVVRVFVIGDVDNDRYEGFTDIVIAAQAD
jgi:hypothetical protein